MYLRKENQIYCSNCCTIVSLDTRVCTSCGFSQVEFPLNSNNLSNSKKKISSENNIQFDSHGKDSHKIKKDESLGKSFKFSIQHIFVGALILFVLWCLGSFIDNKDSSKINDGAGNCSGVGSQSCIDKVRQNFTRTGKTILAEEYLGDGRFGISFMDSQHPGAYNATISTDCNCNITNSNVSTIR